MASVALLIVAGHMVGDYVFQTNWQAARKLADWRVRLWHVLLYTLAFAPVPFVAGMSTSRGLLFLAAVFVPHFIVDCRRWASAEPWPPKPILVDQSLHAACLAVAAVAFGL